MHFLRLLRSCREPCTDSPDRLVCDHRFRECSHTKLFDHATELTPDNLKSPARFTLLLGLTDAEHRNKTTRLSRSELATNHLVTLTKNQATLGMTNENQGATGISQLTRSNLTRERTLNGLDCTILRTDGNRLAIQALHHLIDVQTGREYRDFDASIQCQLTKPFDQLCDAGAGTVHFPVTSYQGATHALPRRSKWAQMLPKVF